jgi:hypothetical protein
MISIDRGNGLEYVDQDILDGPHLTLIDNDNENTTVTEYKLDGKIVHRSVHVRLKKGLGIEAALGQLGGP